MDYKKYNGSSLYGNYRTRTFSEIFPEYDDFNDFWNSTVFKDSIEELNIELIYYLLLSKYSNSNIVSSDENRFKMNTMSIIFQYGPTWQKRLEIQAELRGLTIDQAAEGSRSIFNHAFNPNTIPSTQDTEELNYVNDQNVSKLKKAPTQAAMDLWDMLRVDVSEEFLKQFGKLFKTFVEPEKPLWYKTVPEEEI